MQTNGIKNGKYSSKDLDAIAAELDAFAPQATQVTHDEDLQAELARLRAENEALRTGQKTRVQTITVKCSEKETVSVYGMGRFPVTLYAEQWQKLFANADKIADFIKANIDQLKTKK